MKNYVFCKTVANSMQEFYLVCSGVSYYLFKQKFRKGVKRFYQSGVSVNEAMDIAKSNFDNAIMHTMKKLPIYIKYIEKEYSIVVLDKTKKNAEKRSETNMPYNRAKYSRNFVEEYSYLGA